MVGALGTPRTTRCSASSSPKGVPNIFPFTAARSMVEPLHPLKFAQFSSYYDQVRAATKHFVEKEGKKKVCSMYQDTDFGHEIRDGVREQAKAYKLEVVAEAAYGPLDTEFVAPISKLKSAGCDLVVMGSIISDTIQSVGTARKLGWTDVTFVGQAASYDPIVAGAPGGITEGFYSGTGMPYAYADTSSEEIKAWSAKYKSQDRQGRQQRRAVRVRGQRHHRQGPGRGRQGPDAGEVHRRAGSHQGLQVRCSPARRSATDPSSTRARTPRSSPRSKAAAGRWSRKT